MTTFAPSIAEGGMDEYTRQLVFFELRRRQSRLGTRLERPEDRRVIRDLACLLDIPSASSRVERTLAEVGAVMLNRPGSDRVAQGG
jgi:hypothetical protein